LFAILTIPIAEALDRAEAWDYTHDPAKAEDVIDDILALDALETTDPVAGELVLSVQVVGRDVHVVPAGPVHVTHGHVSYELTIDEAVAEGVIPPPRPILPWVGGALVVGALAGVVVSALLF
jgi:hypothetical protein